MDRTMDVVCSPPRECIARCSHARAEPGTARSGACSRLPPVVPRRGPTGGDSPQSGDPAACTLCTAAGTLFRVFLLASSLGRSSSPEWSARASDGVVANTHTDVARYALLDVSFLSRNDRLTDLEGGLALAKSAVHIAMLGGAAECASRHTGLVNRDLVHNLFSARAHELAAGALVVRPYSTL